MATKRSTSRDWTHIMREDWDARAERDAMYYIAQAETAWSLEGFYREGTAQAIALIGPTLEEFGFDPKDKRILDVGCGMGRLFPGFRSLGFKELWGIDVSEKMIELARQHCPVPGAHFLVGNGRDLAEIPDSYIDYCFEYIVFQHAPDKGVLASYIREIRRVLKPGGVIQLHFVRNSLFVNRKLADLIPKSFLPQLERLYRTVTGWTNPSGAQTDVAGSLDTWIGTRVTPRWATSKLSEQGFTRIGIRRSTLKGRRLSFWVTGQRPSDS